MMIDKVPALPDVADQNESLKRRVQILEREVKQLQDLTRPLRRRSWREKFQPKIWQFVQYLPRPVPELQPAAHEPAPQNAPAIAIVTPSYNYAEFLAATIDSVLAQAYPKLAYLVRDNNSTDGTRELLENYGARVSWRSEPDAGQANAINRGFNEVDGEIMAYLNSDDVLLPGTLAYVAKAFLENPHIDVVYGHRIYVNERGLEIGRCVLPPHDRETIKWADYIPQETMFWRREVWDRVGPLDESFQYAMDWDFILRAQAAGFRFKRLPRFLACFRVHDRQKTTSMMSIGQEEGGRLRCTHLGRPPSSREIDAKIKWYLRRHVLFHRLYKLRLLKY